MRIITQTRIKQAVKKYSQCQFIRGVYSHAEYDKWWKTSVNP